MTLYLKRYQKYDRSKLNNHCGNCPWKKCILCLSLPLGNAASAVEHGGNFNLWEMCIFWILLPLGNAASRALSEMPMGKIHFLVIIASGKCC